jgi:hypothetical protein
VADLTRAIFVAVLATAGPGAGCSGSDICDAAGDAADESSDAGDFGDVNFNLPPGTATTFPLTGCAGPGYAATFNIGSQPFQLTIDTGSGTLAVASSTCVTCGIAPAYTPGSSAVDDNKPAMDSYVKGSWQGEVYTDSVELPEGGTVTMNLAAIHSQSNFFGDAGCGLGSIAFSPQGIVGFGPADLAVAGTDSFVAKLRQTGTERGILGFEFCSLGGQLMIGGIDPAAGALSGPAIYTPMTSGQYYDVTLADLQLDSASLGFGSADFGPAAVDTGTSVLALPAPVFAALTSAIESSPFFQQAFGGQTGWLGTTTCLAASMIGQDLDARLPTLTMAFPGVDGGTSAVTRKATQSYIPPTTSADGTTYYCSGIIQNPGPTGTIIGTSAMLGQLVIIELDTNQVGFAPQTFCP